MSGLSIKELKMHSQFMGWKIEEKTKKDGIVGTVKIPYSPTTKKRLRGRSECASFEQALAFKRRSDMDGVGFYTGPLSNEPDSYLAFIDFDSVYDGREFDPIAKEVMEHLGLHLSFSCSGRGAHGVMIVEKKTLDRLPKPRGDSYQWAFRRGKKQEASLSASGRFCAFTWEETNPSALSGEMLDILGESNRHIPMVGFDQLDWFIREAGPNYLSAGLGGYQNPRDKDNSGSAHAFRFLMSCFAKSMSKNEARDAIESDLGPAGEWWIRTDDRQRDRALERAYETVRTRTDVVSLDNLENSLAIAAEAIPQGDTANAHVFAETMRSKLMYVPEQKNWYAYEGSIWVKTDALLHIQEHAAQRAMSARAEAVGSEDIRKKQADKEATTLWKRLSAKKAALESAQPMLTVNQAYLDTDPYTLGVLNGVLDLKSGSLIQAPENSYITKQAGTCFDATASCPRWMQFLERVQPDDDKRDFIQVAVGYTLIGVTDEEVLLFCYGPGASGKSTFSSVIDALLGDYAGSLHKDLLTVTKHSSETERQVVALQGKRLASVNETARSDRFDDAKIKRTTSREKIPARRLYGEAFDFDPTHTTWIRGNYKPGVMDASDAMWRRLVPIGFDVQIPEQERQADLHHHLIEKELPGILNWALEGALKWQANGLIIPASIEAERQEYRQNTDFIGQWLDEDVVRSPTASASHAELFQSWSNYCAREGQNPGSTNSFSKEIYSKGFERMPSKSNGRRWKGLALKEREEYF